MRVVHLSGPAFDALAAGDLHTAQASSPVPLTPYAAGPDWRAVWCMRSEQVHQEPAAAAWVAGLVYDDESVLVVGRSGYHGPPDAAGMVEIGYAVDPEHRRRGYARAALVLLIERAAAEPDVRTVRVTISPDNTASSSLTAQYPTATTSQPARPSALPPAARPPAPAGSWPGGPDPPWSLRPP